MLVPSRRAELLSVIPATFCVVPLGAVAVNWPIKNEVDLTGAAKETNNRPVASSRVPILERPAMLTVAGVKSDVTILVPTVVDSPVRQFTSAVVIEAATVRSQAICTKRY